MPATAGGKNPDSEHVPSAMTSPAVLQMRTFSMTAPSPRSSHAPVTRTRTDHGSDNRAILGSIRPRPGPPGVGPDRAAHLLVEGEHPGVVGAADQVDLGQARPEVAPDEAVGELARPFRGE